MSVHPSASRTSETRPSHWVRLLSEDPELAEGIPAEERQRAEEIVVCEAPTIGRGAWTPSLELSGGRRASALLVLQGVVTRETILAGRLSAELLGPGDLIRPTDGADALLPHSVRWKVVDAAVVACLDDRFALAARRWPSLSAQISERLLDQTARVGLQLAIAQLPRVEQRLLAILWHLAQRWGRVTPDGYVVPLRLTHEALGQLVGARRPTVSLAVADLTASGDVVRRADGTWMLTTDSLDSLASEGYAGPRFRPSLALADGAA